MQYPRLTILAVCVALGGGAAGCVSQGRYDAKLAELEKTRGLLADAQRARSEQESSASELRDRLDKAQASLIAAEQSGERLKSELTQQNKRAAELKQAVSERESAVAALERELAGQRALLAEFKSLADAYGAATPAELKQALAALEQRVQQTEQALRAASAELEREQRISQKLKALIDAGTLRVRRRAGRLVIELPGDIHFASGKAELTDVGKATLQQLAGVLEAEKDRLFVVEGHTDNVPIKWSGFRSNWHLGATRAEMAREALVKAGLDARRVAIATWADLLPVCPQVDEPACRQRNRRVEVLLLPRFE